MAEKEIRAARAGEHRIKLGNPDYILMCCVIMLALFGVVMVFSSSYYTAGNKYNDMFLYLKKDLTFVVAGIMIMIGISFIPYQNYQNFSRIMYWAMLASLVAVLIIGTASHGAQRWLFGIQPSELAKIILILVLADTIAQNPHITDSFAGVTYCIILVVFPTVLVAAENLSTALIMGAVSGLIITIATTNLFYILPYAAVAVAAVVAYINFGDSFRGDRIAAWKNPEAYMLGTGYQIIQGLYAVGSGGLLGAGLGNSRQKLGFIPESHNDIIFAIICEELGAVGSTLVILLYLIVIWRCVKIGLNATSLYGTLIAFGVAVMIGAQVFINVSVVTNTIPNTGISLPFISYGGTSMIMLMASMGIVLNISRHYYE